jgi:NAD(P)-dependent dehydrogenase (short-subunit alcohol dehydrogenase family)
LILSDQTTVPRVSIIARCDDEIGFAIAWRLAKRGDNLVLCGEEDSVRPIANELMTQGYKVFVVGRSSYGLNGPAQITESALARYGRIDVLVNGLWNAVDEVSTNDGADVARGIQNLSESIQAVVPHMSGAGGGQIVNLISSAGRYRTSYFRENGRGERAAAQAAVDGAAFALTRQFGLELAPRKIRVNAVSIGWIRSARAQRRWDAMSLAEQEYTLEEISLGRLGEPHEVAAAVEFLSSEASSYVTSNAVDVNGGWWMS